jgi:mannose-1-phosphate guanylyltransferase
VDPSDGKILPLILCGGSGERLWPLSRDDRPKQFLQLTGERTMLKLALERVSDRTQFAPPMIIANGKHQSELEAQLKEAGADAAGLILEPAVRNTAPAIALAALAVRAETTLLVMPSDHVIEDPDAFLAAVDAALPALKDNYLVTFGISPNAPETGYGYIKCGAALSEGVFRVERFVEKPNLETAAGYLTEGSYVWNAGIFLFRAGDFMAALAEHAPEVAAASRDSLVNATRDGSVIRPDAEAFARSPSVSVDYAVMEKHAKVAVVPMDVGWSDIGSWDALYDHVTPGPDRNVCAGDGIQIDTKGCLIRSEGPLIATIGVTDLIILATKDSVLIAQRGSSQRVKEVVAALKKRAE